MSLHSQLLRGLFAMPLMLLLAIAGVIAPDAAPAPSPIPPAVGEFHDVDHAVVLVRTAGRRECPRMVRQRVLLPAARA
jgi:hypothetical protein